MTIEKSPRRSFLEEAQYIGKSSPSHYTKKYDSVDPKTQGFNYKTNNVKQKEDRGAFLVANLASKGVSPNSYQPMDAFRSTQTTSVKWNMRGKKKT